MRVRALAATALVSAGVLAAVAYAGPSKAAHPTGVAVARLGLGTVISTPGAIQCGTTCQDLFFEGDVVTLTATPDPGQSFVGWRGCEPADAPVCALEVDDLECVIAEFTGGGHVPAPNCTAIEPAPSLPGPDHPAPGSPCTIRGTAGSDVLRGTAGDDVICGRGGNDTIYARAGHDLVVGGRGNERCRARSGPDRRVRHPSRRREASLGSRR
jgi:hypothetical protein